MHLPEPPLSTNGGLHRLIDSTGVTLCGPGEGRIEKHGTRTRRSWRKLHLGGEAETGRIVAALLTGQDGNDSSQVGPLLDQVVGTVAAVLADGADDRRDGDDSVQDRHPEAVVVVPARSTAVPSETTGTAPTQRDRHLQDRAERGRMAWPKTTGDTLRGLVEASISRFKPVIGDARRCHDEAAQQTESAIAVQSLNRRLDLGRPESVRIAA